MRRVVGAIDGIRDTLISGKIVPSGMLSLIGVSTMKEFGTSVESFEPGSEIRSMSWRLSIEDIVGECFLFVGECCSVSEVSVLEGVRGRGGRAQAGPYNLTSLRSTPSFVSMGYVSFWSRICRVLVGGFKGGGALVWEVA